MSDDNRSANNKKVENEAAEIKATIKETQKDTYTFMLIVLQSIINEQVTAKQLEKSVAIYIVNAVKDQFKRKGWIDDD